MKLVVITAADGSHGRGHEDVAEAALEGGCRAVQLRDKEMPDAEFAVLAKRIADMCREAHALFFVNDRVEVARAVGADGVHLGVEDMDVAAARQEMLPSALVGFSPESPEQARRAVADGADYLGVGPVFSTSTKEDAGDAIGPEGLAAYCEARIAPVIAVGGIDAGNAAAAMGAGAAGVAVVSAVAGASDMKAAVRELIEKLESTGRAG
jgi:thiamine-phosphate diphosphorylase